MDRMRESAEVGEGTEPVLQSRKGEERPPSGALAVRAVRALIAAQALNDLGSAEAVRFPKEAIASPVPGFSRLEAV